MLPLAFVSDVFFSSAHAPDWLRDAASAFPIAPIARALEAAFDPGVQGWPLSTTGLLTIAGWSTAAILVIAFAFRWQPGSFQTGPGHRPGRDHCDRHRRNHEGIDRSAA